MSTDIHRACVAEGLLNPDSIDWLAQSMQELHREDLIEHGPVVPSAVEPLVWDGHWLRSAYDWRVTAKGRADAALYRQQSAPKASALSAAGSTSPLLTQQANGHDVFISHASEDKDEVARPLAEALMARGWTVWLDQLELTIGDSLSGRIDAALAHSRFGVVILSPAFFAKEWPQRELAGLAAREVDAGSKVILPVWHQVDRSYLVTRSPVLADRLGALSSSGIEDVAEKLSVALERAAGRAPTSTSAEPILQAVASSAASNLGFSLGVPASEDERRRLLAARPPGWEYMLFAGVLLEGKNRLETKWHDHELRIPGGEKRTLDDDSAIVAYVRRETRWVRSQLEARMRVFDPTAQERAWGLPGEPGDQAYIEHFARHVLATYELLMDWCASIRNSSVPDEWTELVDLTARLVDPTVLQIRTFIDKAVEDLGRVPELVAQHRDGDPPIRIDLQLELAVDDKVVDAIPAAFERAMRASQADG